jgi:dolichol kinase
MSGTLTVETHDLAMQLHALLRDLDPARWRAEADAATRRRLHELEGSAAAVAARAGAEARSATVEASLVEARRVLAERVPAEGLEGRANRAAWRRFRQELLAAYDQLCVSLAEWDIHVPRLRPTNYARNVLHVASAASAITVLQLMPPDLLVPAASVFMILGWTLEFTRRRSVAWNRFLMWIFGPVAHPHETYRVNSATWYATALVILALCQVPHASLLGLVALGVGDPSAAVIGRAWGRTKLINGRSLEGTLAFAVASALVGGLTLHLLHPELGLGVALLAAAAAGAAGSVAELVSRRVDDNLSIPLAATAGAWLALTALGAAA